MKLNFDEKGSTLIETLVAVALAVVIIVAMVSLGVTSQKNSNFSKNQLVATNLSKQGMEAVRSIRDDTSRSAISGCAPNDTWSELWSNRISALCGGNVSGEPDTVQFKLSETDGFWSLGKNTDPDVSYTLFKRIVKISDSASGYSSTKRVTVITTWIDASGTHKSDLVSDLTKIK